MLCVVVCGAGTRLKTTNALNTTLDLIFTAPTELPHYSFPEEVGVCVASLSLVYLPRVRLHCFSAPGLSQFRTQSVSVWMTYI